MQPQGIPTDYQFVRSISDAWHTVSNACHDIAHADYSECCQALIIEAYIVAEKIAQAVAWFFNTLFTYTGINWLHRKVESFIIGKILLTTNRSQDDVRALRERENIEIRLQERNGISWKSERQIQIDDKTTLNGVVIHPASYYGRSSGNGKWIIYFLPNGALWEECLPNLQRIAEQTQATVLCYNYRQTGLSTGTLHTEEDLIKDGERIIEHIHSGRDINVPYENITLHGYSFGGGVATKVAEKYARKDRPVTLSVCNERSFSSLQEAVIYMVPVIGRLFGFIISCFGWRLNAEESLPYLRGDLIYMHEPNDTIIYPGAQFKDAVQRFDGQNIRSIKEIRMLREYGDGDAHNREWSGVDMAAYVYAIRND